MKISIVTPTYNSAKTLPDTLNSILSQTYPNYEVILVDGGSKDSTAQVAESFRPHFGTRLIWHQGKDRGLYDAMNIGLSLATGDIVGVLNSDDFYASPKVLEAVADGCRKREAVYGDLEFVRPDDTSKVVRFWKGSQYAPRAFARGWHPAHPTFYTYRKFFDRFGGFDINLNVSADFELMLRFLEKNHISSLYIPMVMVRMRIGGESTGSLRKIIEGNKNVLKAFRKNGIEVSHLYPIKRLLPKLISSLKGRLLSK